MRRSDFQNPARFLRGIVEDGGRYHGTGRPLHPIVRVQPVHDFYGTGESGVKLRALILVHQDGFGPLEVPNMPARDARGKVIKGKTYTHRREVPSLIEQRRYCTMSMTEESYNALPLCSYTIRGGNIEDIKEVTQSNGSEQESS